jgi:CS domain.
MMLHQSKPIVHNIDFRKEDIVSNTEWLRNATMENMEYQAAMNKISGTSELQPAADGENGVAKEEVGYSWTQTDEEVEMVIPLKSKDGSTVSLTDAKAGNLKVKFLPKKLRIEFLGEELLSLVFFDSIDPDGSTWTLDSANEHISLIVTCEKANAISWPRFGIEYMYKRYESHEHNILL